MSKLTRIIIRDDLESLFTPHILVQNWHTKLVGLVNLCIIQYREHRVKSKSLIIEVYVDVDHVGSQEWYKIYCVPSYTWTYPLGRNKM